MVAPIRQLCSRCHWKITENYSHPVEVIPSGSKIPEDLPLSWNGRMTCSTCHDIHGRAENDRGERTFFLRRPARGKKFCMACHEQNPIDVIAARKNSHKGIIPYAHTAKYVVESPGIGIDPISMECLSCHDGSGGKAVESRIGAGTWKHGEGSAGPHPIGVSYSLSRARKGGLKPEKIIDKNLKLFNGMVGCGTCHDPYSKRDKKLVLKRRDLCVSCHTK